MRVVCFAICLAACSPAPTPQASGCGKDADCKGDRICVERACVDPDTPAIATTPTAAPSDSAPVATAPTVTPAPAQPTVSPPPEPSTTAPTPRPRDVSSGERPATRCGCPPGDLMCAMRCAQRDNPVGPPTSPNDPKPPSPGF